MIMGIIKQVKLVVWSSDSKKELNVTIDNILIAIKLIEDLFNGGIRIFRVQIEEVNS